MSDKNPEIITLSSDEDSKEVDIIQPSKRKKVDVNTNASKKRVLRSGCASEIQSVFAPKQAVISRNGTRTIELPVDKYQNAVQKNAKLNLCSSSKPSINSPSPNLKSNKLPSSVPEKKFGNPKSMFDLPNQTNSNTVSQTSFQPGMRTYMKKNSIMQKNTRTGNNLNFTQKSNQVRIENSRDKTNIPYSVLSTLREKGISITNIYEKPNSNAPLCNQQLESQSYLNKLVYSLKRSNTNINVVPKTNNASYINQVIKANSDSQASVHCLKNNVKDRETVNLSKSQYGKITGISPQNMSNKSAKDFPFKISSEIKIIEKPSTFTNSGLLNNSSKFVPNSLQKGVLCSTSSVSAQHNRKDPTMDSLLQISSNRSLSVIPFENLKNNECKSFLSIQTPKTNIIKANHSKQTSKDLTVYFSSVTPANSAVSVRTVSSSVKSAVSKNTSKSSSSGVTVTKKLLRQRNISDHAKSCRTKNIDLIDDREALKSFLALCDSTDDKIPPCNTKPKTYASRAALRTSLFPFSSIFPPKTESTIPLYESMKIQDVPSKTRNWPKLTVSLERLDALIKYTEKELNTPETITEIFSLPETNDKLLSVQESIESCKRLSEKSVVNNSVVIVSRDSELFTKISNKEAECHIGLKDKLDTSTPADIRDNTSKNSWQSDCSAIKTLKENEDKKSLNSSSHCTVSDDSIIKLIEDCNNALYSTNSSLCSDDPSQNIEIKMTLRNSSENSDNYLSVNQNANDVTKVKYVQSLHKSDTNSCDIPKKDISKDSKSIKNVDNTDFCSKALENPIIPSVSSEVDTLLKSDMFHLRNSVLIEKNCSDKELERKPDRNFCTANKNFIDSWNISESSAFIVKDVLNCIILKLENKQSEETKKICTEVLNSIVSTIEKGSDSLLTETKNAADVIIPCQESIKKAPNENSCDLLSKNICEGIVRKEELRPHSSNEEKSSGHLTVSEQVLEKTSNSKLVEESINMDDGIDGNTNSEIITKLTVPSKESSKKTFYETTFNLTEKENKCETEVIRAETGLKIPIDCNRESPPFDHNVITEDTNSRSENLNSTSIYDDIEMECDISDQIINNASPEFSSDMMKSSNDNVPFQDKNAIISSSPLQENGSVSCVIVNVESKSDLYTDEVQNFNFENDSELKQNLCVSEQEDMDFTNKIPSSPLQENGSVSCIIVNVESKSDLYTDEVQNLNFENDSELKQNLCVSEQEDMDFTNKIPEPCLKLFSAEGDTRTSDKYACAHTDDERENVLSQVHSNQVVTSPKLSLKRKKDSDSPDHKLQASCSGYSVKNGLKRIKLEESALLDAGQKEHTSSDELIVPFNENREERNKREFLELLQYSKTLMDATEAEKEKIVKNMVKKIGETQSWYAGSEKFSAYIYYTKCRLKRMGKGEDVFSILKDMREEFKNYKKLKVPISKEIIQDTNSACSSFSQKNEAVDGNNVILRTCLTRETELLPIKDSINEKSHNSHSLSASESLTSEGLKSSASKDNTIERKGDMLSSFVEKSHNSHSLSASEQLKSSASKDNTVENKGDILSTSFHSVLASEPAKDSVYVDNTVDKAITNVKSASSSVLESSVLENGISDNQCDSLVIPLPFHYQHSTSDATSYVVENNINEKNKPYSPDLSPLQSLDADESMVVDSITEVNSHLHQSTSKAEQCSLLSQNVEPSSSVSPKNLSPDRNSHKKPSIDDGINLSMTSSLPVDKMNDVLHQEQSVKEVNLGSIDDRNARRIKRLELMLQKLDKKIKQLQERELSLDDLDNEDSVYIREEKYVKRFNKVWELLCKTQKLPSRTGRIIEKKFKYEGSRYRAINTEIEKMINKRKVQQKFPDYVEVLNLVKQVNDVQNIGLSEKGVELEAEKIFRDVGKQLQIRRCRDHDELFGCHLTDTFDPNNDPAEQDEELLKVLTANNKRFEESINQVIDSYAEKQKMTPEEEDNQDNSSSEDEEDKHEMEQKVTPEEDNQDNNSSEDEEDKDLPLTDPASPEMSDTCDTWKNKKTDDDIIEIINDSDKSTDPNEDIQKKKEDEPQPSTSGIHLINFQNSRYNITDSIHIVDSDSSGDLPSIQELMSSR